MVAKSKRYSFKVSKSLRKTKKDIDKKVPFLKLITAFAILCIVLSTLPFVFSKNIPPEVPLFYGMPRGESQLAEREMLVIPLAVSLVVLVVNTTLSYFTKDPYVKKVLVISSFAVTLLSVITYIKIITLVGSFNIS